MAKGIRSFTTSTPSCVLVLCIYSAVSTGCSPKEQVVQRPATTQPTGSALQTAESEPLDKVELTRVPARARWRYLAEFPTQVPAAVFEYVRDGKRFFVFQVQATSGLWYEAYVREDGRKPANTRTFDAAPLPPTLASIPSMD